MQKFCKALPENGPQVFNCLRAFHVMACHPDVDSDQCAALVRLIAMLMNVDRDHPRYTEMSVILSNLEELDGDFNAEYFNVEELAQLATSYDMYDAIFLHPREHVI